MRNFRPVPSLVQWLIAAASALAGETAGRAMPPQHGPLSPEASAVLEFFRRRDFRSVEALRTIRPPQLPPATRAAVIRGLPTEGELNPTPVEKRKIAGIDAVLEFHDRAGEVEVKLIDVFQAAVGLHARCVILVSRRALDLLNRAELQALAAHEIGHDYFWEEYEKAAAHEDSTAIRELELRSDGVALLTMRVMRIPPAVLAAAVEKMDRFNSRFGVPLDAARYGTLSERIRFQKAFAAFADPHAPRASGSQNETTRRNLWFADYRNENGNRRQDTDTEECPTSAAPLVLAELAGKQQTDADA
jgi:hypothetical protein